MPNYQLGKIYKLTNGTLNYYGSTTNELNQRLAEHKSRYKRENWKEILYKDGNIVSIELMENYPCDTKIELLKREKWYIENNECINIRIPTQTLNENRNHIKNIIICECGCSSRKSAIKVHRKTKKHKKLMEQKKIDF